MANFFNKFKHLLRKEEEMNPYGTISIQQGIVHIRNPQDVSNTTLFPSLFIPVHEHLHVLINGEAATGEVVLSEKDTVDISLSDAILSEASSSYSLSVSDDRMNVLMKKNVTTGLKTSLKDAPPTQKAELTIVEVPYFPEATDTEELIYDIRSEGFVGEILNEHVTILSTSEESLELIVMKGIEPVEGVAAFYQPVYEKRTINFIAKNDTIAVYQHEILPIPGADVYGGVLSMPLDYTLPKLGKNVINENGYLKAEKDGRLVFDEQLIEVIPQLIIPGDLVEGDGPIIFNDGDIVIEGRVLEKSFIKASGVVYANDGIYGSTVLADQGVIVKGNISSSEVFVGYSLFLNIKTRRFLHEVCPRIENAQFSGAITYFDSVFSAELFRLYHLFRPHLSEELKRFYTSLEAAVDMTKRSFKKINKKNLSDFDRENILSCQETFRDLLNQSDKFSSEKPAIITSDNVTNSTLYASGKIDITGDGTYLSFLESGSKVIVKGKINGGTTIAENAIEVGEFKSYNTTDFGLIVFDEKGSIRIRKRYADTTLKVGETKDISFETNFNVHFRVKKEK